MKEITIITYYVIVNPADRGKIMEIIKLKTRKQFFLNFAVNYGSKSISLKSRTENGMCCSQ